jgi:hypothetical protein
MFVAAAYIVREGRWMGMNNYKIRKDLLRGLSQSRFLSLCPSHFSFLSPRLSCLLLSWNYERHITKDFVIWQLVIHSRGFFSGLRFPSTIGLLLSLDSFPTAWIGTDEVSLLFYLCLYLNLCLYVFFH